jgi:transcriptional regulator with XRE-family HTH domain
MANGKEDGSPDLLERTRRLIDREGLSQQSLAQRIGISQGHLSKMLAGRMGPKTRAMRRLRAFVDVAESPARNARELAAAAEEAIRTSRDFRALIEAALRIMQNIRQR